jgi:outer membrane protein TolC
MNDRPSSPWTWAPILGILTAFGLPSHAQAPEPISLARAMELALTHAPEVAVAFASENEGAASTRLAEDALRPEALLTTTPGYAQGLPGGVGGRLPAIAEVEVRKALYDPARRADALEAQSRWSLARGRLDAARVTTARAVVVAYGRCWADEARLADAQKRLEAYGRLRDQVEALHGEGRATPLEVERVALQEAQARQTRLDRESDRDLDQLELRLLIGWAANTPMLLLGDPLTSLPDSGDGDDLALAHAADGELRGLAAAAQSLERAETWRGRWWAPVVNVAAQYSRLVHYSGYDEFYRTFKADNWSVGLWVGLPLWTGSRAGDAVARVQANREGALARRRARESELELSVRRAEAALLRATSHASLARRAEGVAQGELRMARTLEAEGRARPADVETREVAVADAHDDVVRAEEELLAARAQRLSLRGELLPAAAQPQTAVSLAPTADVAGHEPPPGAGGRTQE